MDNPVLTLKAMEAVVANQQMLFEDPAMIRAETVDGIRLQFVG